MTYFYSRFKVQGSRFKVQGSRFKVQGSRFKVQGSGFKVQGSGFRVQGSGGGFAAKRKPTPPRCARQPLPREGARVDTPSFLWKEVPRRGGGWMGKAAIQCPKSGIQVPSHSLASNPQSLVPLLLAVLTEPVDLNARIGRSEATPVSFSL